MTLDRLVTTEQAAKATGRAPATIRDWHRAGRLTAYGTGRERRWSMREVALVDEHVRSRKIAGHAARLARFLPDTRPAVVDDVLDRPHDYGISVASRVPEQTRTA